MIVDFEQDPSEPYGTGNFRDEKGRVMYLSDPETASQFSKTMRGAPLGQRVAEESTALATQQRGGAPQRAPDARLASVGAPPATPKSRGQELVESFEQTKAAIASGSASTPTGGTTTQDEEFLATTTGAEAEAQATPGAAPAAGAPAPTTPEQQRITQLVSATASAQSPIAQRSQKAAPVLPKPHDPRGVPLSGVRSGENLSVEEGRPMENVQEQLAAQNTATEGRKQALRDVSAAKLRGVETDARGKMAAVGQAYFTDGAQAFKDQRAREEADREVARLNKAIEDNDRAIDPERYVKNMGTGSKIAMVILAALNGGFNAMIGKKNNDVVDILRAYINDDIEAQKLAIGSRGKTLANRLEHFKKQGFDAKTSETLLRSQMAKNLIAYSQLQSQLMNAPEEHRAVLEEGLAALEAERVKEEAAVLKEAEDKRTRVYQESQAHEVPPPVAGLSPQDVLALATVRDKEIEFKNAEAVAEAVGHPVTAAEAQKLNQDRQEYSQRQVKIATTRERLKNVARLVGLNDKGDGTFTGDPDSGWLGTSKRRELEAAYTLLQRADIESMLREPSANLQDRFSGLTSKPFWDEDIRWQLNQLMGVLRDAQTELDNGYGQDVVRLYHHGRKAKSGQKLTPEAAKKEHAKTQKMLNEGNDDGDLQVEQ